MVTHHRRSALVTGGSTGIGRAIAESLAHDGCDVGIFFLGPAKEGQEVVAAIEKQGVRGWMHVGDISDSAQARAAVEAFIAEFGGIDILINNAGIFRDRVIWKMSDEEWRAVIDVDLSGVFYCSRAAVPTMRATGGGSIVNISSINGLRGKFGQSNYAAAKAGVIGLTKSLARELARSNTTVNAVAPGLINTSILDAMPEEEKKKAAEEILLGRIGTAQDVADLVVFLCSDRARFITGEVIRVDGGQYI